MRNTLAIAWRELRTYFSSPLAYVVIGVFVFVSGLFFWISLAQFSDLCLRYGNNPYVFNQLNVNDLVIRPLFGTIGVVFLLMLPAVSMRLLAEERRAGTAELLFTCPVTTPQIVLGKYLGSALLLMVMLAITLVYPLLILTKVQPDMAPALVGYLGVLLMGLTILSIGLFVSSLTDNQIVAAVGAFGANLLLWIVGWAAAATQSLTLGGLLNSVTLGVWEKVGLGTGGPTLGDLFNRLSITGHFQDFRKGLIDTEHVVFFLTTIFFALFLTQRVLESRRWR